MKPHSLFSVFCRSVGPGGTTVEFYPEKDGLIGIWSNENCPYVDSDDEMDDRGAAKNGHNVSKLAWEMVEDALYHAIEKGLYEPKKLRRI
jgi:hypothetical protein